MAVWGIQMLQIAIQFSFCYIKVLLEHFGTGPWWIHHGYGNKRDPSLLCQVASDLQSDCKSLWKWMNMPPWFRV
jgi:hypothetical protein